MLSFLKKRIVLEVLGLILLALAIWFAGPYFAFADWRPLASEVVRWVLIGLCFATWAAFKLAAWLKARRANQQLAAAATAAPAGANAPTTDELQLRERFAEAVAALDASAGKGQNLYSLPWYVFIGPPGSGKTTVLENSGLHFPLAQRFGREALRGVGGTRNCDWWFTDDAIFLDTAGRFTTQDSDPGSDARGWKEFLALLRKYRKRRPLNGVILTVSATDLLTQTAPGRDAHMAAARRRLDELNRELNIRLPVYLLVTKCDLVAGFTEYFDDQTGEDRKQVWGVTFPYENTLDGSAPAGFATEFDALIERLNARLWRRLDDEREARRRAKIFGFPQQLASLKDVLNQYVTEVFAPSRLDTRMLLRGVYFTSGTQEGTPVDRLVGSLGRAFAFGPEAVPQAAFGRGKVYFIERLLREVVLAESGLAGVNRRLEIRLALAQAGAYVVLALLAVFGVGAFVVSYARNAGYLDLVASEITRLSATPPPGADSDIPAVADRLNAVRRVHEAADRYHEGAPLAMRFGLYKGKAVAAAARDAYERELNGRLLPRVALLFRQRLFEHSAEPEKLYEYLKAYLMLGDPSRLQSKAELEFMTDLEWRAFDSDPLLREALHNHMRHLLDTQGALRPVAIDQGVVEQARGTIRRASVARLIYGELVMTKAGDTDNALRLDREAGIGLDQALARRSGRSWAEPVPAIWTKKDFQSLTGLELASFIAEFTRDNWVLGEGPAATGNPLQLRPEVIGLYERDYIAYWDSIVADLQLPRGKSAKLSDTLAILASREASPLRGLLQTIDANTYLVKPPEDQAGTPSALSQIEKAVTDRLTRIVGSAALPSGPAPGTQVTNHFAPIHDLVKGTPGATRIDATLQKISQVQQQLNACGASLGQTSPAECVKRDPGPVRTLAQEAKTLPSSVGELVGTIATAVDQQGTNEARGALEQLYDTDVLRGCEQIATGRYPFVDSSSDDVPLADFGRLLGYGGLFDSFFTKNIAALVDTSTRPWRWRTSESGASPGTAAMLRQFEAAQRIRELFFHQGSDRPEVRFTVTPTALDPEATRFALDVDGQVVEYRHGPERAFPMLWPGAPPGGAGIAFDERNGGHPSLAFHGPWAFFRLLDSGNARAETDARYRLGFAAGAHSAEFVVEVNSIYNPVGKSALLHRFACRY